MKEKRDSRRQGCGCCLAVALGFVAFMVVVMGPWFPRRLKRPYHLHVLGASSKTLHLAWGESKKLQVVLLDRSNRPVPEAIKVEIRSLAPEVLSVDKGLVAHAHKPGQVKLAIVASVEDAPLQKARVRAKDEDKRARLRPARRKGKKARALARTAVRVWKATFVVWISPWRLEARLAQPKPVRSRERFLPAMTWFVWQGKPQLLVASCLWPAMGRCRPRWRLWVREAKGWQKRSLPMPTRDARTSMPRASCFVGSKLLFVGRYRGTQFVPRLRAFDLQKGTWEENTRLPKNQRDPTPVLYDGRLYLFGGASNFADHGSRRLQIYLPSKQRWEPPLRLPDRSWDQDAGAVLGASIYLLNRQGRLWSFSPATRRWQTLPRFPRKRKSRALRPLMAALDGSLYVLWTHPSQTFYQLWRYEPQHKRWKIQAYLPYGFAPGATMNAFAGQLWLTGQALSSPSLSILRWTPPAAAQRKSSSRPTGRKPTSRSAQRAISRPTTIHARPALDRKASTRPVGGHPASRSSTKPTSHRTSRPTTRKAHR